MSQNKTHSRARYITHRAFACQSQRTTIARSLSLARAPLSDPYFTERAENYCYICQAAAAAAAFFSFLQKKRRARLDKGGSTTFLRDCLPLVMILFTLSPVISSSRYHYYQHQQQQQRRRVAAATLVYNNVAGSRNFFALIMWNRADGGGRFRLLNLRPRAFTFFAAPDAPRLQSWLPNEIWHF